MATKMLAAIDVGSFVLSMKIFEISTSKGIRQIDHIRYRIDLGTDTYTSGKVTNERADELCRILKEFTQIMRTYKVDDYRAYATSAIRETSNMTILLDQIRQRTGLEIEVLSNSEQRFLDYKSVASKGEGFHKIIEKRTAFVDIGGGSVQISLFDKDSLVTTQNLKLGVLRLNERLNHLQAKPGKIEELADEMISAQLTVYKKMYLKEKVENIIVVDDYLSPWIATRKTNGEAGYMNAMDYDDFMMFLRAKNKEEIAEALDIPQENAPLLFLSAIFMKRIVKLMEAELIWAPGVALCDGMAYEYAQEHKLLKQEHDFEQDMIACAKNISKRYMGSRKRGETLEKVSLTIFDSMRKIHGLGKRERLLLQIASILHDCGKFISMVELGKCSYQIIMATEIIGLSHAEREIVANVVRYNHDEFAYYESMKKSAGMEKSSYLVVAKLTAILRVANALDRSHKQKFKDIKARINENQLIIQIDTPQDITLEKGLFDLKTGFFQEVFNVKPVIRSKKII